mmetsp:Transcript_51418/g.122216  ORF Transcript_51418/g.122216 Transcript_51418/m.122216 type:complete len:226 (+) Transcript_51418:926-1603(+)
MRYDMLRIHHCENSIQAKLALYKLISKECLCNWRWISQASRLDDNSIKWITLPGRLLVQLLHALNQITSYCAANAAIVHLNYVLLRDCAIGLEQGVIDAHLTKLILDHCYSLSMVFLQDVVQQCSLTRPQEACDDGARNLVSSRAIHPLQEQGTLIKLCLSREQLCVIWLKLKCAVQLHDSSLVCSDATQQIRPQSIHMCQLLDLLIIKLWSSLLDVVLRCSQDT